MSQQASIKEIANCHPGDIPDFVFSSSEPLVLRDFAADWPVVKEAQKSSKHAADYLRGLYRGDPVFACYGPPENNGRVFYNEQMNGFNFQGSKVDLNLVLDKLFEQAAQQNPPTLYVSSTEINSVLPQFNRLNNAGLDSLNPLTSIWLGNQTRIAAHYDFPHNLACCIAGRRRFTLFPPEQVANLYVGPMELSPGGQDISLVDIDNPNFDTYPKFKQALDASLTTELAPGDALFIPSMWWHHVAGLEDFNALITHWWRDTPAYLGRPEAALELAILSLRSLPDAQRKAWQSLFEHYVFEPDLQKDAHIPADAKGMLTLPLDLPNAKKIRAGLLNKLKV